VGAAVSRPAFAAALMVLPALALSGARAEVVNLAEEGAPITAHWLPVAGDGPPRATVVGLHGCGGRYRKDGRTFEPRYAEYVERLHRAGYHVLLPDSFAARGERSICTQRSADRRIKVDTRRGDVAAAVRWLARQPTVDARRIALLGWSHGAMTALASLDRSVPGSASPVAGAVVFYPGCRWLRQGAFEFDVPLLVQLGAKDDWTPGTLHRTDRAPARPPTNGRHHRDPVSGQLPWLRQPTARPLLERCAQRRRPRRRASGRRLGGAGQGANGTGRLSCPGAAMIAHAAPRQCGLEGSFRRATRPLRQRAEGKQASAAGEARENPRGDAASARRSDQGGPAKQCAEARDDEPPAAVLK